MKTKTVFRSLFSEYELGGCRELEQVNKSRILEISTIIPETFEIEKIERLNIVSINESKEKIEVYASKSIEQLTVKESLKIKEKLELVTQLTKNLIENKLFMDTFFMQFTNKLYHITQQHKNSILRKFIDEIVKDSIPKIKQRSTLSYGTSCPMLLINNKVAFEF